jgi:hypothetical protein
LDFEPEENARGARPAIIFTYERLGFEKTGTRTLDDINNSIEYGFHLKFYGL